MITRSNRASYGIIILRSRKSPVAYFLSGCAFIRPLFSRCAFLISFFKLRFSELYTLAVIKSSYHFSLTRITVYKCPLFSKLLPVLGFRETGLWAVFPWRHISTTRLLPWSWLNMIVSLSSGAQLCFNFVYFSCIGKKHLSVPWQKNVQPPGWWPRETRLYKTTWFPR